MTGTGFVWKAVYNCTDVVYGTSASVVTLIISSTPLTFLLRNIRYYSRTILRVNIERQKQIKGVKVFRHMSSSTYLGYDSEEPTYAAYRSAWDTVNTASKLSVLSSYSSRSVGSGGREKRFCGGHSSCVVIGSAASSAAAIFVLSVGLFFAQPWAAFESASTRGGLFYPFHFTTSVFTVSAIHLTRSLGTRNCCPLA